MNDSAEGATEIGFRKGCREPHRPTGLLEAVIKSRLRELIPMMGVILVAMVSGRSALLQGLLETTFR